MKISRESVSQGARVTLTGLLLGAVLCPLMVQAQTPAPAGAKETVEIKDEKNKPPAGQPAAAKPPAGNPAAQMRREVKRDPFVNYNVAGGDSVIKDGGKGSAAKSLAAKDGSKKDGAGKTEKPPEPEVPPPDVTVHGIVLSGTGNRAILTSPKQTYIVRQGDKLGDYRVDSVAPKLVVFRYKDKVFKLKMEDEFSVAKKK